MSEDPGASRRALLGGAATLIAGTVGISVTGCGTRGDTGQKSVHKAKPPVQTADIALLTQLLDLERRTVAAYTAGLPLLDKPAGKAFQQFLNEELEHTGELISLIKAAGGKAPQRTAPFQLGHPRTAQAVLALLHYLEHVQIATYLDTIPRLSPGPVRAAAATILNSDAQHIAVLRSLQGLVAMPSAFVTGQE